MEQFLEQPIGLEEMSNLKLPNPELILEYQELKNRVIRIDFSIDDLCFSVSRQIIMWNKMDKEIPIEDRKPIFVYISSPGGDPFEGTALQGIFELSKTPIIVFGYSLVASAAMYAFLGAEQRYCLPTTRFLIHLGSVNIAGNAGAAQDTMEELQRMDKEWETYLLSKTNITKKLFNAKKKNEWWLTAQEALQYGIVTKIVSNIDDIY